jgi:hypothetical protein
MAIHHAPVVHVPARSVVRDHRAVQRPIYRAPVRREPNRFERGHGIVIRKPIIERPVYIQPTTTVWTPSPGYTYAPQPLQLMAPTALASELSIDVNLGGATTLDLQSAGTGSTYVSQVLLIDADGATRALPVNQVLSAQNPTVQLPLDNCAGVSRIVLQGHSDWGGSLALTAA